MINDDDFSKGGKSSKEVEEISVKVYNESETIIAEMDTESAD